MTADLTNALNIHRQIKAMITGDADALMRVPEIEDAPIEDAIHKLQVQVIALSDALKEVATYLVERDQ